MEVYLQEISSEAEREEIKRASISFSRNHSLLARFPISEIKNAVTAFIHATPNSRCSVL